MRCDGKPRVAAGAALMIASALFFTTGLIELNSDRNDTPFTNSMIS